MGAHLIDGEFQSDKYPDCPRGKVPLSTKDPAAQDLIWTYAIRRRAGSHGSREVDSEFADDLQQALRLKGYSGPGIAAETADAIERFRPTFALIKRMLIIEGELAELARMPELDPHHVRRMRELSTEKGLRLAQMCVQLLGVPDPGTVPDNLPTR